MPETGAPYHKGKLEIIPVSGRKNLKDFISLPWSLYSDDPAWVPPLLHELKKQFSRKNPYFRHATLQAWIAKRGKEAVGRITAQLDTLHLGRYNDSTGFFGMLEAQDDPEVFKALFDTAESWLSDKGISRVRGPFNFSINSECGLLVEGFDTPPMLMMGHALPYYGRRIEEQGFRGVQNLLAYKVSASFEKPRHLERLNSFFAEKITLRPLKNDRFKSDLAIIKDIFEDAWSENWGYLPFTDEEFQELGKSLKFLVPPDFVRIAEIDGEPVAMMVVFPNLNQAIRDLNGRLFPLSWLKLLWRLKVTGIRSARIPLMGVRRRFHNSRLGAALALMLITSLQSSALKRGLKEAEMSWILESNKGMHDIIESIGGTVYKRYRIYEKSFYDPIYDESCKR